MYKWTNYNGSGTRGCDFVLLSHGSRGRAGPAAMKLLGRVAQTAARAGNHPSTPSWTDPAAVKWYGMSPCGMGASAWQFGLPHGSRKAVLLVLRSRALP